MNKENLFSVEELNSVCKLNIKEFIGAGNIAAGAYRLINGDVLKIYQGMIHLREIDITSRIEHPGIVKTKGIITSEDCNLTKQIFSETSYERQVTFEYGLIMEYVKCVSQITHNHRLDKGNLSQILNGVIATILLLENEIIHTDISYGNQCFTSNSYTIVDFNNDRYSNYIFYRQTNKYHDKLLDSLDLCLRFYGTSGVQLSNFQKQLAEDLFIRLRHENISIMLDIYEIPTHPLFKNIPYDIGLEKRWVNFNYWPAREFDYFTPLRKIIEQVYEDEDIEFISMCECIDLYYRYLPFIEREDELESVAANCFELIEDIYIDNYDDYSYKIINNLKGIIFPRWIHHKCRCMNDMIVCWSLMGLPYDDYMKLNPERFYEIIPPAYDQLDDYYNFVENYPYPNNHPLLPDFDGYYNINKDIVQNLMLDENVTTSIVFSKLTVSELIDFLQIYDVSYIYGESKFYLADLAKRTYIYYNNKYGDDMKLTQPVIDLIHSSKIDLILLEQYTLKYLLNMSNDEIDFFADKLELDPNEENVRERIIRILRMNYLIIVDEHYNMYYGYNWKDTREKRIY